MPGFESHQFDAGINVTNGSTFDFGPMGNLLGGSDSTIDVAGGNKSLTLTITSATGMVQCVEN